MHTERVRDEFLRNPVNPVSSFIELQAFLGRVCIRAKHDRCSTRVFCVKTGARESAFVIFIVVEGRKRSRILKYLP